MIRRLTVEDLPQWLTLESSCFSEPWGELSLQQSLAQPRHLSYGYFNEQGLQAVIVLSSLFEEAELLRIAVLPEARQQGVALQLWQFVLPELAQRGVEKVLLEVASRNQPALRLYQRLGFAEEGVRRGYYHDEQGSDDALLMSVKLLT